MRASVPWGAVQVSIPRPLAHLCAQLRAQFGIAELPAGLQQVSQGLGAVSSWSYAAAQQCRPLGAQLSGPRGYLCSRLSNLLLQAMGGRGY